MQIVRRSEGVHPEREAIKVDLGWSGAKSRCRRKCELHARSLSANPFTGMRFLVKYQLSARCVNRMQRFDNRSRAQKLAAVNRLVPFPGSRYLAFALICFVHVASAR